MMCSVPAVQLKGRSLLSMTDWTPEEWRYTLEIAARLKRQRRDGVPSRRLTGRQIALVFEKSSTRTRCAFVAACAEEGGTAEYLGVGDIHLGRKESIADTARVLGRFFHGIAFRGYQQETVEDLARWAGVPVWNALTDQWHPTQVLADLLTIREHFGRLEGLRVCYVGDGRNNVANSLMFGCARFGMHFVNVTPPELAPSPALVAEARVQTRGGGSVSIQHDPYAGVVGANVVYTDVWVSMGEEAQFDERLRLLRPYQVNTALMAATGRKRPEELIFLHCLPAYHDHRTEVTVETGPLEVTDDVFEGPFSRVFDQAENRMHTIRAILLATLVGGELT